MISPEVVDGSMARAAPPAVSPLSRADSAPLTWRAIVATTLAAFALYSVNVDYTLYGDAAMYADYVVRRDFSELTLHIGYYAALFLADKLLGTLLGIPIQETAVWLNVSAATLSVGVALLLGFELLGNRRDAVLCALCFAFSGRLFNNATTSEIYALQTLLVLSSFLAFVRDRIWISGILCAVSLLVSPLSLFAFLFYPVYDIQRSKKVRWRHLVTFAVTVSFVYVPYLCLYGHELFWGSRGLLLINHRTPTSFLAPFQRFPMYQFKAFTVLSLLVLPALLAWRSHRTLLLLALAVGVPHFYIIAKLIGEDHVFILNTDFFFCCILVLGWRQLIGVRWGSYIGPVLFATHIIIYVASGQVHSFDPQQNYANEMRRIHDTYLRDERAILITDWGRAVALTFYGRTVAANGLLRESLFVDRLYVIEDELPNVNKLKGRTVYLLDEWKPGALSKTLQTRRALEEAHDQHSIVAMAERDLKLRCVLIDEGADVHRVYRCAFRAS